LVSNETIHCFVSQLPFIIVIYVIKNWIYHNYIILLNKSNFKMFFFPHILFKQNIWKLILEVFSNVYTCIVNKHTKFHIIWKKRHSRCIMIQVSFKWNETRVWWFSLLFKVPIVNWFKEIDPLFVIMLHAKNNETITISLKFNIISHPFPYSKLITFSLDGLLLLMVL
jgi:hypothetical protein